MKSLIIKISIRTFVVCFKKEPAFVAVFCVALAGSLRERINCVETKKG